MSTKRDLVEAHSFSRRRLVTAFVSGAPGGREVEPVRPGRTLVGGLALAILMVAGAAIAGIFVKRTPQDWLEPGLIIAKDTGTPYVILPDDDDGDPELRPLDNNTSAKLIFGSDLEPKTVADEDIAAESIGNDIGIFGAPAALPAPEQLINGGWTACTNDEQATLLRLADDPGADIAAGRSLTVQEDGKLFLLVDGSDEATYKFELPDDEGDADNILDGLGATNSAGALEVSQEWLNLFPAGPPLTEDSFVLEKGEIDYVDEIQGLDGDASVGDVVKTDAGTFLLTVDGPVLLTGFAEAVYVEVSDEEVREASSMDKGRAELNYPATWPAGDVPPIDGDPCVRLEPQAGEQPTVRLAEGSSTQALPEDDVDAGKYDAVVQPGRGAFVLSAGFEDSAGGQPYVVDAKGDRYLLKGPDASTNLGYDTSDAPIVPDTWMALFGCGVQLSKALALEPPNPETEKSCESD